MNIGLRRWLVVRIANRFLRAESLRDDNTIKIGY